MTQMKSHSLHAMLCVVFFFLMLSKLMLVNLCEKSWRIVCYGGRHRQRRARARELVRECVVAAKTKRHEERMQSIRVYLFTHLFVFASCFYHQLKSFAINATVTAITTAKHIHMRACDCLATNTQQLTDNQNKCVCVCLIK